MALAGATIWRPGTVHAHAILMASTPPAGATLPPGPQDFTLKFNIRLDRARSRLTLVRPGDHESVLPLADTKDDVLATHAVLAPGAHVLRWQVLAIDGHITRGEVRFTVKAP